MSSSIQFSTTPIEASDIEDVIIFMKKFFFKDEPLNQHMQLTDCPELEVWARDFEVGCSFKATNPAREIIGVITSTVVHKKDIRPLHNTTTCTSNYLAVNKLLQYIDDRFNVFDRFPHCERALETKIISVDESYRGLGIGKALVRRTLEYMEAKAISLYVVSCTNEYSTRVYRRLGFEEKYALKYTDYIVDGTDPVRPDAPHDTFRILAKIV